jgi:hypothetical protein
MAEEKAIIGSYQIEATNGVVLCAKDSDVQLNANGELEGGSIQLDATSTVALNCGPATILMEQDDPEGGKVSILGGTLGSVLQAVGVPNVGPKILLEPEVLTISIGPPGAGSSIILTPESIILQVGTTVYTLTAEGIVEAVDEVTRAVTAEGGHVMTAAESVVSVTPEGVDVAAPTINEVYEGSATFMAATLDVTIEGMKTEEAGMEMIG